MKIPKLFVFVVLFLVVSSCNRDKTKTSTTPTPAPGGTTVVVGENGLSGADRQNFYHLPEGSELFPYAWMKALHTANDQPFLQNPERFGLLPDPNHAEGLPIGLTVANRSGVPLGEMVGVNCAACHVAELKYQNTTFRVDGGQNLFDLGGFYGELFEDTRNTVTSPDKLFAFLVRWWQQSHDKAPGQSESAKPSLKKLLQGKLDKPLPTDPTRQLLSRYQNLDDLRKAGPLEKELADQITALVEKHKSASTKAEQLQTATDNAYASMAKKITAKHPGTTQLFDKVKSASDRVNSITHALKDIDEYIALLYSYMDLLKSLGTIEATGSLAGGFGRVDAFGGARNLLFPASAQPATAPVCYPYLWGFSEIAFFHNAANTNSILERNIGQALGLGATFDKTFGTFATSVDIKNTNSLEELAYKIQVPEWPAAFGAIDADKAAKGKILYQQNCAGCHEQFASSPPPDNMGQGSWVLNTYPVEQIGTDPNEAKNFPVPVNFNGKQVPLPEAIATLIPQIAKSYYASNNISHAEQTAWNHGRLPAEWRAPQVYSARPMAGVWATPPYLHNGSVLTLYDLLLPAAQRPAKFFVGSRKYDPVRLGYVNEKDDLRVFELDTTKNGNSNAGHEYGTTLSEDEKMQLLEFMKTFKQMPLPKE
ncbi:MAG TPA: di-heme-cytochrome C peroxidase [Pyrinomonadaceae bacterium]|nr:di-heme-cytochrome C peroxidase [Pyrinomonadaceae bacterium]